jgi:hypothetical protein
MLILKFPNQSISPTLGRIFNLFDHSCGVSISPSLADIHLGINWKYPLDLGIYQKISKIVVGTIA